MAQTVRDVIADETRSRYIAWAEGVNAMLSLDGFDVDRFRKDSERFMSDDSSGCAETGALAAQAHAMASHLRTQAVLAPDIETAMAYFRYSHLYDDWGGALEAEYQACMLLRDTL